METMDTSAPPSVFRSANAPGGRPIDFDAVAGLVSATADIAVVVDSGGIVTDMALGDKSLAENGYSEWIGRPWVDSVTVESKPKIEELLRSEHTEKDRRWRQVNHKVPNGPDLPVNYIVFKLAGGDRLLAFGRQQKAVAQLQQRLIEAQQMVEREYARLRHSETRYRMLFQSTSEPVLIVDAANMKIMEANPAACALLGEDMTKLAGRNILPKFAAGDRSNLETLFSTARSTGRVSAVAAHIAENGNETSVSASLFRQEKSNCFLVRLGFDRSESVSTGESAGESLSDVISMLPDGFVVTDERQVVLTANGAFLDLVQLANESQAKEEPLSKWFTRADLDVQVLLNSLRDHGSVRNFATELTGELGVREDVEISAVAVPGDNGTIYGFSIRQISAAAKRVERDLDDTEMHRSVEQLTKLVGRVPLKEIVRETTDMIERMCIEAALDITQDNRASAAEVLGLSRQSLYVKLRRFDIGESGIGGDD